MKKINTLLATVGFLALTGLSTAAWSADAPAASAGGLTFGIVDMNKVLQTSDAAKDIFSQMESKRKEYEGQISKEEEALRKEGDALKQQKATLSKEAFEEKAKALQGKFIQEQKLVDTRKRTLDRAFSSSITSLRREAAKIVAAIAKEKNYSVVLTEEAVMMSTPDLDMTDAVITQMNKDVKKIAIDWSSASGADAAPAKKDGGKKK